MFGIVLVVGMALAGFAVYMVKGLVGQQETALAMERQRAAAAVPTTDVYAVNRVIAYGEPLTPADIVVIKYASDFLPEGTFATLEELFPDGEDVSRFVLRPMEEKEVILAAKVTKPGEMAGIAHSLRPAMRAFTIKVDATTGVSGFLRPGNRVDIYWTGNLGGPNSQTTGDNTYLIGSGIELIAVDQSTDANSVDGGIPGTVTVQVAPQDVASLAQAQSNGRLTLALVGVNSGVTPIADGETAITLPAPAVAPEIVAEVPQEVAPTCLPSIVRGTDSAPLPGQCSN
jgi:pilus assembly protein CpaB